MTKEHKHTGIYAQWNGPSETKPNPENCKNCSSKCAYDCAQLQYTIQHRTVLIISPLTSPDKHHSSDAVYWRGGVLKTRQHIRAVQCNDKSTEMWLEKQCSNKSTLSPMSENLWSQCMTTAKLNYLTSNECAKCEIMWIELELWRAVRNITKGGQTSCTEGQKWFLHESWAKPKTEI